MDTNLKDENKSENICPVCGKYYFENKGKYEICPICGWEDDRVQRKYPDFKGGANKLSINEAREIYRNKV